MQFISTGIRNILLFVIAFSTVYFLRNYLQQSDWSNEDLLFMHTLIVNDHPGMVNAEDPKFAAHLEQVFAQAQEGLKTAKTDQQKIAILKYFVQSFDGNHIRVSFTGDEGLTQNVHAPSPLHIQLKKEGDVVWVKIPTFQIKEEQRREYDSIAAQLPSFRNAKKIVFDLRGNNMKANSWFGSHLVAALFGNEYHAYYQGKNEEKVVVDWRVTPDNLQHVNTMRNSFIKQFGQDSDMAQWISNVQQGMENAYKKNQLFYSELTPPSTSVKPSGHKITAKIIVIIDNDCAGVCLNFIDDLYAMGYPITLLGQTTKGTSMYMETRQEQLPSGKGVFSFPIKVYRNRPRGDNQPYSPDIQMPVGNEEALKKVISDF